MPVFVLLGKHFRVSRWLTLTPWRQMTRANGIVFLNQISFIFNKINQQMYGKFVTRRRSIDKPTFPEIFQLVIFLETQVLFLAVIHGNRSEKLENKMSCLTLYRSSGMRDVQFWLPKLGHDGMIWTSRFDGLVFSSSKKKWSIGNKQCSNNTMFKRSNRLQGNWYCQTLAKTM